LAKATALPTSAIPTTAAATIVITRLNVMPSADTTGVKAA